MPLNSTFKALADPTRRKIIIPFSTPQTVQAAGLSKSILIGRCLGILLIVLGIFLLF